MPQHRTRTSFKKGQVSFLNGKKMGFPKGVSYVDRYGSIKAKEILGKREATRRNKYIPSMMVRETMKEIIRAVKGTIRFKQKKKSIPRMGITEKCCSVCGVSFRKKTKFCSMKCYKKAIPNTSRFIDYTKTNRAYMQTPEFREMLRKKMMNGGAARARKACGGKKTSIEKKIEAELIRRNIPYDYNFQIGNRLFDFRIGGLLIECDGSYWHSLEKTKERDEEKNELGMKNGFVILRYKEEEIRDDTNGCVDEIEEVLVSTRGVL